MYRMCQLDIINPTLKERTFYYGQPSSENDYRYIYYDPLRQTALALTHLNKHAEKIKYKR